MLDSYSLGVTDMKRSRTFYDAALARLGIAAKVRGETFARWAKDGRDDFSISLVPEPSYDEPVAQAHFAFTAPTRTAVDAVHAAALRCGGRDDGEPALRLEYHPNYYAAFVVDPDGYRIEVVCHAPE